jgi:hypothetical protein
VPGYARLVGWVVGLMFFNFDRQQQRWSADKEPHTLLRRSGAAFRDKSHWYGAPSLRNLFRQITACSGL